MAETVELKSNVFSGGGVLDQWSLSPTQSGLDAIAQSINELKQLIQASSGSAVKSVQRGTTSGATRVTINAVDMSKAVVLSVSKGSEGYVAARGSFSSSINLLPTGGLTAASSMGARGTEGGSFPSYSGSMSGSLSGGSTDLTTKQYSAKLISATQLQTDGPVEWQVIEYA